MPKNQRVAVLLAAWCQLRHGELHGLRRRDIDLLRGAVSVRSTVVKKMDGRFVEKDPKTEAGRRLSPFRPTSFPQSEITWRTTLPRRPTP